MSIKLPKIGSDVYVPTIQQYLVGGLAKVVGIASEDEKHQILVEEHSASYAWENGIGTIQENLREQFGNKRAYSTGIPFPCPIPKRDSN